jgi:hypothetical protein
MSTEIKNINEKFPININLLIEMKVYNRKDNAKSKLIKHFILDIDYIIKKSTPDKLQVKNPKAMQAGKNKENIMLTVDCFKSLCLSSNSRQFILNDVKQTLKNDYNIILDTKIRFIPIETETITYIMKVFNNEKMKTQYCVGIYRIDLYFKIYKLSIECNENDHIFYNQEKEIKRKKYIENKLECSFITYNPNEKDFCIFNIINSIYIHIKNILIK